METRNHPVTHGFAKAWPPAPRVLSRQTGAPETHLQCLRRRGGKPTLRAGPEDLFVLVNKKVRTQLCGAVMSSICRYIWDTWCE